MPVSEKTRKILWARSGNRCAICRKELVVKATKSDPEAIVGDECHILSPQAEGPRHDPSIPKTELNKPSNLLLLCRNHHKEVDDQLDTYPAERLREIKRSHEEWVSSALRNEKKEQPVRIVMNRQNIATALPRLLTAKEVFQIVEGAHAFDWGSAEDATKEESEVIGDFLQGLQDYADIAAELGPKARLEILGRFSDQIQELLQMGFMVFGIREAHRLEGGGGSSSPWLVARVHVQRDDDPNVKQSDNTSADPARPTPPEKYKLTKSGYYEEQASGRKICGVCREARKQDITLLPFNEAGPAMATGGHGYGAWTEGLKCPACGQKYDLEHKSRSW